MTEKLQSKKLFDGQFRVFLERNGIPESSMEDYLSLMEVDSSHVASFIEHPGLTGLGSEKVVERNILLSKVRKGMESTSGGKKVIEEGNLGDEEVPGMKYTFEYEKGSWDINPLLLLSSADGDIEKQLQAIRANARRISLTQTKLKVTDTA